MVQQAPATDSPSPANVAVALPPSSPAPAASPATTASRTDDGFRLPGLDVSGDMRVRQEWNFVPGHDRSRTAVRARRRASYPIDDHFTLRTPLAPGAPDDPNRTTKRHVGTDGG